MIRARPWFAVAAPRSSWQHFMSMAMATRSNRANPSDARIPCPVCGQQIHPVAGRCKHCKTDLVKMREQHGQRAPKVDLAAVGSAPVPAAPPVFLPAPDAPGPAPGNGHAPPPTTFAPPPEVAPPPAFLASYPETPGAAPEAKAPRWPLVVVLLAGIAIIVCAYILLFAGDDSAKASSVKKSSGGMPAPDRMETMPAPPPVQVPDLADPWTAPPAPDPAPAPTPNLPSDPFADPFGAPPPRSATPPGGVPIAEEFMAGVFDAMCRKAAACGLDQIGVDACNLLSSSGFADLSREEVRAGRCTYDEAKAARCLASIDALSCNGTGMDLDQALGSFLGIGDCTTALVCR